MPQIHLNDDGDLYVLWSAHGAYQHLRCDGQNTEVFELPVGLSLIWPKLPSEVELVDEYERGYENGYDNGYDAGSEEAYEAGLDAGRDW